MPRPRETLISLDATPYYHCVSRCVRRAFLCGEDAVSGKSFEHRKGWIEVRLLELAQVFSINVCAYAVMSNHCHLVLHVDPDQANQWSVREVIEKWHELFAGTFLSQRFLRGDAFTTPEMELIDTLADTWRERLTSVSWFMRCLNEYVARLANEENGCTGRFWEGRFKSQALLDEAALFACMAYVDLNPVRAAMTDTPEASDHTSVQRRIKAVGNPRQSMPKGLMMRLEDYLDLVDWSGRNIQENKRGAIPESLPHVLERLHINPDAWFALSTQFEYQFKTMAGQPDHMQQACSKMGKRWVHGIGAGRRLFIT